MRTSLIFSLAAASILSGCAVPGDFCAVYEPINATEAGASAFIEADREAARRAAQNEAMYLTCP